MRCNRKRSQSGNSAIRAFPELRHARLIWHGFGQSSSAHRTRDMCGKCPIPKKCIFLGRRAVFPSSSASPAAQLASELSNQLCCLRAPLRNERSSLQSYLGFSRQLVQPAVASNFAHILAALQNHAAIAALLVLYTTEALIRQKLSQLPHRIPTLLGKKCQLLHTNMSAASLLRENTVLCCGANGKAHHANQPPCPELLTC
jgi:hypothetical protein